MSTVRVGHPLCSSYQEFPFAFPGAALPLCLTPLGRLSWQNIVQHYLHTQDFWHIALFESRERENTANFPILLTNYKAYCSWMR